MCVCVCVSIYKCTICVYVYIYIKRETRREVFIYIYTHTHICMNKIVKVDPMPPIQYLLHRGVRENSTPFPELLNFTFGMYYIMLSVKKVRIKYHFFGASVCIKKVVMTLCSNNKV